MTAGLYEASTDRIPYWWLFLGELAVQQRPVAFFLWLSKNASCCSQRTLMLYLLLNASACLLNWTFFGSLCSLPGARTLLHHPLILLLLPLC